MSLALIATAIGYYIYLLKIGVVQHAFHAIQDFGLWGVVIGICVQMTVNVFPVPGEFTTLLLMEIYGPALGGVYSWIGGVLGAIGAYYLAKWLSNPFASTLKKFAFTKILERYLSEQEALGLLMARFVPFLPYHMINYAAGILKANVRKFIWTTMIGLLPYHIAVSGMYAGVRHGSWTAGVIGFIVFIALIGISRVMKKRKPAI
ncbi:TVP38/TMEM64 family protein [Cohnella candidum]|uniref:TVP38/TMEM64 family protein n=1 Tax=Cohnella candidum TaxID=2674991 RepID=UPI0013DDB724|nr:VTT domain-containing protein [Cohnella candidum]